MDQDLNPNMAGGTNTGNMVPSEPGQNTQTSTNEATTIASQQPTMQTQISRPVDSSYIKHDLRIPKDKTGKSKRHTAIIISVVIGVLALIIGGLAIWFFAYYNSPDKVMLDGVNNLLKAENVSFNGGGSLILREEDDSESIQNITLNLDSSSSSLPNSTNVSLLILFNENRKINLQLGTVVMSDGVIYLKVSGIMDSLHDMNVSGEDIASIEGLLETVELIDDEWWRISLRDILGEMGADDEVINVYGEFQDCALSLATRDNSQELADMYKQNKFITVEPVKSISDGSGYFDYQAQAWHNLYEIKFDKELLASFVNTLPDTEMAKETVACINTAARKYGAQTDVIDMEDFHEISASDIDISDQLHLFVEISQFSHKIRSIQAYSEDEYWNNAFGFKLDYGKTEVVAPSEYRNITELFEVLPIEDAWWSISPLGDDGTSGGSDNYYDNCSPGINCGSGYSIDDDWSYDYDYDYDFDNTELPYTEEIEWES